MTTTHHHIDFDGVRIGYKLFMPKVCDGPVPCILFLHGVKKRGNDLSLLDEYGLIRIAEENEGFKYAVIAPQCPSDTSWNNIRPYI